MNQTYKLATILLVTLFTLVGCQTAYYNAMEKIGYEKRDLLKNRVKDAKDSQEDAKEEFESAYDQFSELIDFDGGNLEKTYRKLKSSYEDAKARADEVVEHRKEVEAVGRDMFKEWRREIDLYSSESLKAQSLDQLETTSREFDRLIVVMKRAESKIKPVLDQFQDRVLFLKHNLNARAVTHMQQDNRNIQQEISQLIRDMKASINEANTFIESMGK